MKQQIKALTSGSFSQVASSRSRTLCEIVRRVSGRALPTKTFRVVPFVLHDLHDLHGKALKVGRPAPRYFPAVNPKGTEPRSNEPWEYCGNRLEELKALDEVLHGIFIYTTFNFVLRQWVEEWLRSAGIFLALKAKLVESC